MTPPRRWPGRRAVRATLARVAPGPFLALTSARHRAHAQRLFARWGCLDLNRTLIARFGPRVLTGPFAGLALTPLTHRDHIGPYLLGTYEHELHGAWEEILARSYSCVVDVGSRFGYYAVGLARRYPGVPVVAADPDWWARAAVREMAAANGTPNVRVRWRITPGWLAAHLPAGALVVSDCEGCEASLFARDVRALHSAMLVIEVHEFVAPGITAALERRFSPTHHVRRIRTAPEPPAPPVDLSGYEPRLQRLAVNEIRLEQEWLVAVPVGG